MAWFLALQGATQPSHQSSVYELQDSAGIDKLAQELIGAVTLDRVVPIPAMLPQNTRKRQKVTLYVRPAAWGMWTFYELSDEVSAAWIWQRIKRIGNSRKSLFEEQLG